jgi:MFS transporter, DHA1 family, multidrug resistance protein
VNIVFTWFLLPETHTTASPPRMKALARNYGALLASPAFVGYAVGGGCATTSMYAFISASPFIFAGQLHRPAYEVGIYLAVLIGGIWIGSALTARLITRMAIDRLMVRANLLSVLAAAAFLIVVVSGHLSVPLAVAPMFVYALGVGMASPAALTQAISVNSKVIGSASGLYGFAQMGVGAVCTALAGVGSNPALTVALVLAGAGTLAQTAFWIALRYREPAIPTGPTR